MIVCICKAVSDRQIQAAVMAGAASIRDITRELRVGTCCGKCIPEARAALEGCLGRRDAISAPSYFPRVAAEFAV